ncbi:hypothetical protein EST38_g10805 [Candolleomyces aberdarensis]|uniref:Eukaryotic translation initiation factor 3 subunit J n=1 Tax=Candolleomyces aberdarensis TaxID=2316362 RepID=A0A4Q2D6G2_9AGAR|nr:hypothetical protein EST38_g10805 [Candolleomyces aberdarensis]
MSDWEDSDSEPGAKGKTTAPTKAAPPVKKPAKSKWDGEDEEEEAPVSDWEESSEESEEEAKPVVAPPKKKGTLKAKLAEKEAEKAQRAEEGDEYDSDDVLDPRAKALKDKERELNSDLSNAAELFGAAGLGGSKNAELDALISAQPRTKEDFQKLSSQIFEYIIKRHQSKPLYASFVEQLARDISQPLKDVEVRKVASNLTTLSNEKQKEQKDKASGKKKKVAKPILGGSKVSGKGHDTNMYDEALDDFGNDPNDFM